LTQGAADKKLASLSKWLNKNGFKEEAISINI